MDIAPFAVFLNNDDINYVEPDILVVCDISKLDDKGCHGAPDWMIEVVSPSSKQMDYYRKLFLYRAAGVRLKLWNFIDMSIISAYNISTLKSTVLSTERGIV